MQDRKLDSIYKGRNFNNFKRNSEELRQEIFLAILSLLHDMTNRHDRVFFMMFTLNIPSTYPEHNTGNYAILSRFIVSLTDHCRNERHDPMHFWTRESASIGHEQYHFMLLIDGDIARNAHSILEKVTELWTIALNIKNGYGLVHLCNTDHTIKNYYNFIQNGGVILKRKDKDFSEAYIHCFNIASDMAMRSSNDGARAHVNEYGCSRHT